MTKKSKSRGVSAQDIELDEMWRRLRHKLFQMAARKGRGNLDKVYPFVVQIGDLGDKLADLTDSLQ